MFKYGKFSVFAYTYTYTCNTPPVSLGMHILHKNLKLSVVGSTRLVVLDTTEYTHTVPVRGMSFKYWRRYALIHKENGNHTNELARAHARIYTLSDVDKELEHSIKV